MCASMYIVGNSSLQFGTVASEAGLLAKTKSPEYVQDLSVLRLRGVREPG
jgi:hypothetical protein